MTAFSENQQHQFTPQFHMVTLHDFINFKNEIILEFKNSLKENAGQPIKKWLITKSGDRSPYTQSDHPTSTGPAIQHQKAYPAYP